MNSKIIKLFLSLLLGVVLIAGSTLAEEGDGKKKSQTFNKITADPVRAYMNINNISTIIKNDGISDINIGEDASGLIFPKGSGKTAVYTSGFLWAGKVNDPGEQDPHVGGTVYRTGLQPGWIDASGNVITEDPRVRIYRVRPDAFPGLTVNDVDVSVEAQDQGGIDESVVLTQYQLDWQEWPADLGAPFFDGNGDGVYSSDPSSGDIPGVPGADQTIWYVTNDQEAARTTFMYGTQPMGIEMQATFWAYAQTGALGNMFFRRYLIINKTDVLPTSPTDPTPLNRTFDSMYVSMWSDPDVGDAGDDFAGCDTALSMTFAYNGQAVDPQYNPLPPPAVGFDFFQGPLVDGVAGQDLNKNGVDDAEDFGIFKNQQVGPGKINLPMTAAFYYINEDPTLTDPVQGSYTEGAVRWYRFMQGRIGLTGQPFVDPITGLPSPFTLTGDPVAGTGWVDGLQFAPGDRRIGAASGPFTMAPGDTQEVVVAEIVAGAIPGMDFKSAVTLMKFYDVVAQNAYDNFFDLPPPPPRPSVNIVELDEKIVLDWGSDMAKVNATESFDEKGYQFQGYNVYQLPSASADISEGRRLATFDIIDEVKRIIELDFDPNTAVILPTVKQFGTDSGIKRFFEITTDELSGGTPLINGIRYYFAVSAYSYTPDSTKVPTSVENPLQILTVIPNSNNPGVILGEDVGTEFTVGEGITHEGLADGGPVVTVVDPTATTGHEYEISFYTQAQIRNTEGNWVPAGTVLRKPGGVNYDPDDLTGSSILISCIYPPIAGDPIEMHCTFDYVSSDGNWADGIELDIEAGITIVDFPTIHAGGGDVEPVITGDPTTGYHIELGFIDPDSLTADGVFHGGEEWIVYVELFEPPKNVDWVIWDDGWSGTAINAVGTTTIDQIGFAERTARLWQLEDRSISEVLLEDQTVVNGVDLYPPRDDSPTILGPDAAVIVDGVHINLEVLYDAPISISANNPPTLNGTVMGGDGVNTRWEDADGNFSIIDFTWFGYPDGYANTALPLYGGIGGTLDIEKLQQDYELRWTGVLADTVIGADTVTITQSGGSIATINGASNYDFNLDHPLNPDPGSGNDFTLRIPFEVWNVTTDQQVNLIFYDRNGNELQFENNRFRVWNSLDRVYAWIVDTPYSTDLIDDNSQMVLENATWNLAFYHSEHTTGDVVEINYDNPIVQGVDTYRFRTTESTYSSELARNQVNEINVFPNPYYGINTEEINKYNRFVTFTHLPEQAKVRIFNLAGVLVRTLDKEDPGQFLRWNLANEDGLPVASGLYIAYIELPELGATKILKLAIVQEQQVLDRF